MKKVLCGLTVSRTKNVHDLDGSLDKLISELTRIKNDAEVKGYNNLYVNVLDYNGSVEWYITGDRLETDREEENRISFEVKAAERKKHRSGGYIRELEKKDMKK